MSDIIFSRKGKEVAFRRMANKAYKCHEGNHRIEKGDHYVDDHINYIQRGRSGEGYKRWTRRIVCEGCWRAPVS